MTGKTSASKNHWSVEVAAPFKRDLRALSPKVVAAILEFVTYALPENPKQRSKELTSELEGMRSARRGDYRVLFEIDEVRHVIILHRVAHRSNIYR